MGVLWKRLEEKGSNWRQVFKSLQLLEYLLRNGHDRVAQELRDCKYKLKSCQDFQHYDNENRDRGRGIREQTKILLDLIENTDRLRDARKKAEKTRKKMEMSQYGRSGGWSGGGNTSSSNYSYG